MKLMACWSLDQVNLQMSGRESTAGATSSRETSVRERSSSGGMRESIGRRLSATTRSQTMRSVQHTATKMVAMLAQAAPTDSDRCSPSTNNRSERCTVADDDRLTAVDDCTASRDEPSFASPVPDESLAEASAATVDSDASVTNALATGSELSVGLGETSADASAEASADFSRSDDRSSLEASTRVTLKNIVETGEYELAMSTEHASRVAGIFERLSTGAQARSKLASETAIDPTLVAGLTPTLAAALGLSANGQSAALGSATTATVAASASATPPLSSAAVDSTACRTSGYGSAGMGHSVCPTPSPAASLRTSLIPRASWFEGTATVTDEGAIATGDDEDRALASTHHLADGLALLSPEAECDDQALACDEEKLAQDRSGGADSRTVSMDSRTTTSGSRTVSDCRSECRTIIALEDTSLGEGSAQGLHRRGSVAEVAALLKAQSTISSTSSVDDEGFAPPPERATRFPRGHRISCAL